MISLWVIKSILVLYIVVSPFFNHKELWFMHHILFKISMLLLIIAASFIDMQLAIILAIAFLVMIVNTNKHEIMMLIKSPAPLQESAAAATTTAAAVVQEESAPTHTYTYTDDQEDDQIPEAYCPGHANPDLSGSILAHMTTQDSRIKPFEEFVNVLSPNESLENIQSNLF